MPVGTFAQERAWRAAMQAEAKRKEGEQRKVPPAELRREEQRPFGRELMKFPLVKMLLHRRGVRTQQAQVGVAETLARVEVKPLISYFGITPLPRTPIEVMKPKETVKPLAGVAGLIAPAEALTYTVGRLAGLPTPPPPPTIISFEPSKAVAYGPEYAAGTIAGDILLSLGIGKVATKAWEIAPKVVKGPVAKVAEKVAKPFRPITRRIAPRIEKAILWPHQRMAPGIVSIPTPKALSMKGLEAQQLAWELTQAPKTTGLMITKVGPKKAVFTFTKGVGYTPMSVTLARAMGVEQMGGRQALLQVEKPALKKMPFIPSAIKAFGKTSMFLPAMLGLATLPALISAGQPQMIERMTTPLITPITRLAPIIGVASIVEAVPTQKHVSIQQTVAVQDVKQIQHQAQKAIQTFAAPPTPTFAKTFTPFFDDPFKRKRGKRKIKDPLDLFGRYRRVYPLATPKQVLKMMIGKRGGKRK